MPAMSFPKDFAWGVATSSYQIEGATETDGKGPSVWDSFCRKPGAIRGGHDGRTACEHYQRYAEDVALMRQIGVRAYRFSVCWPRILPAGVGQVNQAGIDFYDRLVDALLEAGVTPYVTLFHWEYPLALYRRGGWLNPDSSDWFADYAGTVVRALTDRVKHWITLNEVQVFIVGGHYQGWHAPGDQHRFGEMLRAGHHALLAHGKAVQAIRANAQGESRVGYAPVGQVKYPVSNRSEDVDAARQAMFATEANQGWTNAWWMDPVMLGEYPASGLEVFGTDAPVPKPGDMKIIGEPIDFFGVNIYQGEQVRAGDDGRPEIVPHPVGCPMTGFNWPVTPEALYWGSRFFYERYQRRIIITENGLSCRDWISLDGRVHDPQRIDFAARYLRELHRAMQEGVPVDGYFHWSLMDNFEWAEGYLQRFGLIYVDFDTQARVLKDSAYWYRDVISTNGAKALADPGEAVS